jgi:lipoprotein NlpI
MRTRCSASISAGDPGGALRRIGKRRCRVACRLLALVIALPLVANPARADAQDRERSAEETLQRAMTDFESGRVAESVVGFDRVMQLAPRLAPELWQRGIALYYVDRFKDCRAQFELHRTVNPADVENAAWHYLCVARAEGAARAQAALLPVRTDPREPMREVYLLFAGKVSTEAVLVAGVVSPRARFYAALYVGLYYEAQGNAESARFYIAQAAADEFAGVAGYMHDVARVHMQVRKWTAPPPTPTQKPKPTSPPR